MLPSLPAALIVGGGQTSLVSDPPARLLVRKRLPTAGSGKTQSDNHMCEATQAIFSFFGGGSETIPTFCFLNEGEQRELFNKHGR